jgi:putative sterol carrier protein
MFYCPWQKFTPLMKAATPTSRRPIAWPYAPHNEDQASIEWPGWQGTIRAFLRGLSFVFQKGQSKGLNAVYHYTYTGQDEVKATVTIRYEKLQVSEGHNGQADLRLTADTETWRRFLRKEANLIWALLRRKIRTQGSPELQITFGRCLSIVNV